MQRAIELNNYDFIIHISKWMRTCSVSTEMVEGIRMVGIFNPLQLGSKMETIILDFVMNLHMYLL